MRKFRLNKKLIFAASRFFAFSLFDRERKIGLKKILALASGLILAVALFGCGGGKYRLNFGDNGFNSGSNRYDAGSNVTVHFNSAETEAVYSFFIDDDVPMQVEFDGSHGYNLSFVMPEHDVTLSLKKQDVMEYGPQVIADDNNEQESEKPSEELTTEVITETQTAETEPADVSQLPAGTALSEEEVALYGEDAFFTVSVISEEIFGRMNGRTFKDFSPVSIEELRYIRCLHKDLEGRILIGELVMHESVADDVCDIFHELYKASYPIEKMHLADDYDADDEASMTDNNTSGFNVRFVEGTDILCNHAYGTAVDINPFYNVYYIPDQDIVYPAAAYDYKDRDNDFPYKILPDDLCYKLFTDKGFVWGGWWGAPDYQHFEKQ